MKCPRCQFENPEKAKFCIECGQNLTSASTATPQVPSFEERLEKLQRYLPSGLAEKILSQKDRIEGERKQLTIMFCDMKGYSPLTEQLGPEATFSLIDQVYEILIHKVHEYQGTVNELRGDGILALFGAPIALEDAPQRAVRSALDIHSDIAKFNNQKNRITPIKMRIGIHTGPVVVGTIGNDLRVQFTAVGDTINLASRMEGLAEPGTTYVTKQTYQLTKDLFQFEALGEKVIKGKKKPIPVYKVLSGKEDVYRPRLGSERMIYSEMVGREKELDRLELQVMKAINGEGSVVNIIGEAGIGKSRLVAELKKRDVMNRVTLFEGRAISIGRNLSFHPIIDVLKQWAQIKQGDSEAASFYKLETAIKNYFQEDVNEILPFVATLMGMKLSGRYADRIKGIEGEALEKLIFRSMRELVIKATELSPLVIVGEDLHWADMTSIELLESLFRLVESQKILFINVFRPDYEETGNRIIETVKEKLPVFYVEILLEPLDERMCEELITSMLNIKGGHHAVINQIIQRVGGNPFFIEEVVRSFIDEGAVVLKGGRFEVTEKVTTIPIPNTINDVLMSRIDRLEEKTRDLLKLASVIGRNFFYKIITDLAVSIDNIDSRLSYLKEIQLIRERRRMDEIEYIFNHTLAQEAAYESILFHKRKDLHLKVAHTIEKIFGDRLHEFYGMLAYHYSRAEDMEKSEEYLIRAGEEALKSSASNEALHYYQEALALYLKKHGDSADPEKVSMLNKNIALAIYNRGQGEEAVEYFDKALNYYWGKTPYNTILEIPKLISSFSHFLIGLYLPSLKFKKNPTQRDIEAIDLNWKKCEALFTNPKRWLFESFYLYKRLYDFDLTKLEIGPRLFMAASSMFSFSSISFRLSRKVLDSAKDRVNEYDTKSLMTYKVLDTLLNYFEGNWVAINEYDDDLVNKNLSQGDILQVSYYVFWHGIPNAYQGSLETAKSIVNKLNDIYVEYGNDNSILLKLLLSTYLLMECRKLYDTLTEIEKGIDIAQKTNQGTYLIHFFSCKARIQILMGDIQEAEKSLEHAEKFKGELHPLLIFPWMLANFRIGEFERDLYRLEELIKNGNKAESSGYSKKALKSGRMLLKQSKKVAQNRTESYRLIGVYFWLINKQNKALKWWNKSIEEGERLGARLALSRTYFEVGKSLLEPGSNYKQVNGVKAEEYLEKAKVLLEEMDLQWDLDELGRMACL